MNIFENFFCNFPHCIEKMNYLYDCEMTKITLNILFIFKAYATLVHCAICLKLFFDILFKKKKNRLELAYSTQQRKLQFKFIFDSRYILEEKEREYL